MTMPNVEQDAQQSKYWFPSTVDEVVRVLSSHNIDISQWGLKTPEDLLTEIFKGESRMTIENGRIYRNTRPIIITATFERILPDGSTKEELFLHEAHRVQLDDEGNPTGILKPRKTPIPGSLAEKMIDSDHSTDDAARRALREELKIIEPPRASQLIFNGIDTTSVPADKVPVYQGIGIHRTTSYYTYTMPPSQFHSNGFIRFPQEAKIPPGEYAYAEKDMQSKTLTLWQWSTKHPRKGA